MDYNKEKYAIALDVAKTFYESPNTTDEEREILRSILPELAESEDEMVGKWLIEYFKDYYERSGDTFCGMQINRFLAYLEKQKEQKPIKVLYIPKFREGDVVVSTRNRHLTYRILNVGNINELGNPEYKVEIFTDGKPGILGKEHNIQSIEIEKMDEWGELMKQSHKGIHSGSLHKEPDVRWIKEDEEERKMLSSLTDFERAIHRGFLCAGVENVPVGIIKETAQDCLAHIPAEWSEEERAKMKHEVWMEYKGEHIKALEESESRGYRKGIEDGKILAQSEWKEEATAEGIIRKEEQKSVKDKIVEDTISYLNGGMCFCNSVEELKYRSNLAYRLKSLRPSWKPSEEQMDELKKASEEMCGYNAFDVPRYPKLKSLYEQLKTL